MQALHFMQKGRPLKKGRPFARREAKERQTRQQNGETKSIWIKIDHHKGKEGILPVNVSMVD